ncbi:MAG: FmdB family zinc ribbon protein [Gammaproteobacteria bacterium]
MPIYEYRCDDCGEISEALQKVDEPALDHCPKCGSTGLKRVMSATVFRLKGSGWYETDFKSGSRHNVYGEEGAHDAPAKPDAGSTPQSEGTPKEALTKTAASASTPSASAPTGTQPTGARPAAEKSGAVKPKVTGTTQPAKPANPSSDS